MSPKMGLSVSKMGLSVCNILEECSQLSLYRGMDGVWNGRMVSAIDQSIQNTGRVSSIEVQMVSAMEEWCPKYRKSVRNLGRVSAIEVKMVSAIGHIVCNIGMVSGKVSAIGEECPQ